MEKTEQPHVAPTRGLKKYTSPTLSKFGRVRTLTTGGSGMASEGEMGNAKPRP